MRSTGALAAAAALVVAVAVTAGCGDAQPGGAAALPDRSPDVTGVVAGTGEPGGPVLAEPSDGYYEGMSLLRGEPVVVRGSEAETVASSELEDGQSVDVWTDGACAESFPVQCGIVALRLHD